MEASTTTAKQPSLFGDEEDAETDAARSLLAKDVVIGNHQVAIKQILSTLDDDAGRLLIEEMETLASLDHLMGRWRETHRRCR